MNAYPNYSQWQALVLEQHAGLLAWCGFVAGLLLLWLLWRWRFKRYRLLITVAAVAAFFVALGLPIVNGQGVILQFLFILPLGLMFTCFMGEYFNSNEDKAYIAILLFALTMRLPNLFTEQMWYDETVTAAFSQAPLSQLSALGGDTHPPLFYLPFWLTAQFLGTSQLALRLPSLLFGVLNVYLVYRLTLSLGMQRKTALVAALIVAVLPGALRYSNEARAYAQLTALVLGMGIAVLEDRPRWFAGLAAATILTQNMGYVYVFCIGTVAFLWFIHQTTILSIDTLPGAWNYWSPGPFKFFLSPHRKDWIVGLAIPALVGLAWLPFMLRQLASVSGGWWVVFAPGAIPRPLFSMTVGTRIPEPFILQVLAIVLVITVLGLFSVRRWLFTTAGNLWVVLCFGTPAIAAVVSIFTPVYVDRALLPSALAIPIVWAYLLTGRRKFERIAAAGLLIPVLSIALNSYYVPDQEVRDDWRARLVEGCQDTQVIFNTSLSTYFISRYYTPERTIIAWSGANDINLFLPEYVKQALGVEQAAEPPPGDVCILDLDTPISRADERAYVRELSLGAIQSTRLSRVDAMDITVNAYVVRLP